MAGKLCYAGMADCRWLHLSIKINFKRERGGVKHRTAVIAMTQMELHLAGYFGYESPLKIFTNQANSGFACHGA